eukprot:1543756-Prymnesium_polylepis.1
MRGTGAAARSDPAPRRSSVARGLVATCGSRRRAPIRTTGLDPMVGRLPAPERRREWVQRKTERRLQCR